MEIRTHVVNAVKIAEVISDDLLIQNAGNGLDLLGTLYYQGFDSIILHQHTITPDFFDLKNGLAGEILQKFSTYSMRLAIVGNFNHYTQKSIKDFIFESNKLRHINFVPTVEEALHKLSSK